jgi:DNA-binding transcriptional LysR family regulator
MTIELRQLQYFVAVAEQLHFRGAAERLFISQPTLSHQIATLEKALGVRLLDRDRRRVALTDAGAAMLEDARQLLAQFDQTVAHARWAGGLTDAGLRVGFPAYGAHAVRELLQVFRREHPEVWLEELGMGIAAQIRALEAGTLDVGFVRPPVDAGLAAEPVLAQELVVALPSAHRLATLEQVPLRELAGKPLLMPSHLSHPGYYAYVTALCQLAGFRPTIVPLEESQPFSMDTLLPMVAAGTGLTLLTTAAPRATWDGIAFRPVTPPSPLYKLAVAWRPDDQSPHVRTFVEIARITSSQNPI